MAMGASYCFGIKTPRNFRAPFLALDVRETLGSLAYDAVHAATSISCLMRAVKSATRRKLFKDRLQTACAGYMANFMLMGAWHGLTVDYLVYWRLLWRSHGRHRRVPEEIFLSQEAPEKEMVQGSPMVCYH